MDFYTKEFMDEDRMTFRKIADEITYRGGTSSGDEVLSPVVVSGNNAKIEDSDFSNVYDGQGFVIDKRSQVISMLRDGSLNFLFTEKEADARVFLQNVLPGYFEVTEEVGGSNWIKVSGDDQSALVGTRYKADDKESINAAAGMLANFLFCIE